MSNKDWFQMDDDEAALEYCNWISSDYSYSTPISKVHTRPKDEEKEGLVNQILEMDTLLERLKQLPKYKGYEPYHYYYYEDKSLYKYSKKQLKSVLRNLINRIRSILWYLGYTPDTKPHLYTRDVPRTLVPYPYDGYPFYRYYHKRIAPFRILNNVGFAPFRTELSVSPLDDELVHFTLANMQYLCELETIHLQKLIEDGKVKESELTKWIKLDLLKNPKVTFGERREIENEIIRHELSRKPLKQRTELLRLWQQYVDVMRQRKEEDDKRQKQELEEGLRRKKELEEPKQGKPIKRKKQLGISAAEEICKRLSTESRQKKRRKAK